MDKRKKKSCPEPEKCMECPICCDIMTSPIIQCEASHSMCEACVIANSVKKCPLCRGPMTGRRNLILEQLIESLRDTLKISCCYNYKGCKYNLTADTKDQHEQECRLRNFKCEGKAFAKWNCNWMGEYSGLEEHFKKRHPDKMCMQYRTEATLKINFNNDYKDTQLISFFNGQSHFYYKHLVDVSKQKLYWAFQYIGLKNTAAHFFYEFEVFQGPIRKFKVTEICQNDTAVAEDIFAKEKCVVMSFATAKNYLNEEGELPFKFRIMKNKPNAH